MPTFIESNPILSEMKKLVVKLEIYDDKAKQKALKTVSSLQGIDSIAVDLKERKLTVIGTVDPVNVVSKLRKYWQTDLVTVGPAMEPETKKEEPKHEGESGGDATAGKEQQDPNMMKPAGGGGGGGEGGDQQEKQKDEEKEGGDGKKGEAAAAAAAAGAGVAKKVLELDDQELRRRIDPGALELVRPYTAYRAYNNPQLMSSYYYHGQSMEENPNACSIC